jgi:hypothetical protein
MLKKENDLVKILKQKYLSLYWQKALIPVGKGTEIGLYSFL